MTTINIKNLNSIMFDKQFKLCDVVSEFSRFRTDNDKIRNEH